METWVSFLVRVSDDDDVEYDVVGSYRIAPPRYYDRFGDPGDPGDKELDVAEIIREDGYILNGNEQAEFEDKYYQQIWDQISLEYGV